MKKTHKGLAKRLVAASLSLSLLFAASLTSCSDDEDEGSYYVRDTSGGVYTPTSVSVSLSDTVVNTVTLSWYYSTYNVGIYGWVYINTEDDAETSELLTSDITISYGSYVKITYDIELEESGTYYFWVRTANSSDTESATNISDLSDAASIDFTYKTDPNLDAPTDLESEVDSDSTSQVNLTWSAVDGASYYWVYYNTTNDADSATLISSEVTGDDEDSGSTISYSYKVSYAGNYWFWVKAADGTNTASFTSDFSDSSGLYVSKGYSLTAPTDVAAADSGTTNTVKISWTKTSSSRYYYSIYYNTSDDSSTATLLKDDVYAYSTSASTTALLTESGTYYFWVKTQYSYSSSSGVHTSDFSDVSEAYEFTYTDLEAPESVKVSRPYTNTLQVSWSDNGAAYFFVYYNTTDDTDSATRLTKTTSDNTYLSLSKDDDNTTYYFWVQSSDDYSGTATSGFSDAVSYSFSYETLSAPTTLTATYVKSLDEYKLSWSSGALYHRVWQNTEDDTSSATKIKSLSLTYCYVDLSGEEAGTYYFWVQAADGTSSSDAVSDFSECCTITIEEDTEETEE